MRRMGMLAALTAAALGLSAGVARAAHTDGTVASAKEAAATVTALSVVPGDGRADVIIALSGPVRAQDFTADNPDRIVLDITGARMASLGKAYDRKARGGIRNIRYSQFGPSVVRIVLDLDAQHPYVVTRSETEIRVSVSGGEPFAAWHSGDGAAIVADVAPASVEPAIATGQVALPPVVVAPVQSAPPRTQSIEEVIASSSPAPVPARTVELFSRQSQQQRISITWEDAPIADVLASFAEISGRTIVRGRAVEGTVSAEIKDQPWDVAMKAILDAQGLAATEENSGIIVVDSYENILQRQASEPLTTQFVNINYVSAASIVETVKTLLSKDCATGAGATTDPQNPGAPICITRGTVTADSGTNSLLVQEVSSRLPGLLSYIQQLDVRTPQVFLKAKIISVSRTSIEQLGISYDLGSNAAYFNQLVPRNRPGGETVDDRSGRVTLGGEVLAGMGNASRKYQNSSALSLLFSTALGKYSLTAFLDALQEQQLSDIQAEPSIVTLDNREARILVGEETPVRVIDAGAAGAVGVPARANVQFKETGIILTVTPHITSNRQVRMSIAAEQSELRVIGGDLGFTIPKRNATTQLLVSDGETAVIGGLTQTQVTKNKSGIPLLSDLPLLGRLFSQTDTREEKRDLLILITPHIIDAGEAVRPPGDNDR